MSETPNRVTIRDIDIPFVRLVVFFVKAALAMIPAALIVWLVLMLLAVVPALLLGNGFWMGGMSGGAPPWR